MLLQPKVGLYAKLVVTHLFFTPFDEAFYNLKEKATEGRTFEKVMVTAVSFDLCLLDAMALSGDLFGPRLGEGRLFKRAIDLSSGEEGEDELLNQMKKLENSGFQISEQDRKVSTAALQRKAKKKAVETVEKIMNDEEQNTDGEIPMGSNSEEEFLPQNAINDEDDSDEENVDDEDTNKKKKKKVQQQSKAKKRKQKQADENSLHVVNLEEETVDSKCRRTDKVERVKGKMDRGRGRGGTRGRGTRPGGLGLRTSTKAESRNEGTGKPSTSADVGGTHAPNVPQEDRDGRLFSLFDVNEDDPMNRDFADPSLEPRPRLQQMAECIISLPFVKKKKEELEMMVVQMRKALDEVNAG